MPRPHLPEFRRRSIELARLKESPIAQTAGELGISESCLRGWARPADNDEGNKDGLSTDDRAELVRAVAAESRAWEQPGDGCELLPLIVAAECQSVVLLLPRRQAQNSSRYARPHGSSDEPG